MVENSNRGSSFQKIKPIKPNVSPYSWRRKKNSNATVEMELATYKIINIMNKSKMKRTSSVILTFIDMITKTEFDHMRRFAFNYLFSLCLTAPTFQNLWLRGSLHFC